jgi:hypothetical protein
VQRGAPQQGYEACLLPALRDGVFLCWLAGRLTGRGPPPGVNPRPLLDAHRRANIGRAIACLREEPDMTRRRARGRGGCPWMAGDAV